MPTSPDVQNYHIGKGIVSFKETGGSTFTDLGNAPSFIYTPTVEKKEHFSSREGIKTKDFTAITQVGATVKFTLDEITATNLAFFALGDVDTTVPGAITINGLSKSVFEGDIKLVGTNDIGQHIDFTATVSFVPSGDFSFITDGDDFSTIEIEAEVQKDATSGAFGVWTIHDTVTP
jgi:sorbitol-specific phosphotransferase system component IIA